MKKAVVTFGILALSAACIGCASKAHSDHPSDHSSDHPHDAPKDHPAH